MSGLIGNPGRYLSPLAVQTVGPADPTNLEPRIFNLFVNQTTNPVEYPVNNIAGEALHAPGSCMLFDPTGAQFAALLEVAFDGRQGFPGMNYIPLYGGVSFDMRPASFKKFSLRTMAVYANAFISTNAYVGRLIVTPSLIANIAGATSANPTYTRSVPLVTATGTWTQGTAAGGSTWVANPGGTGIFAFQATLNVGTLGLNSGVRYIITNLGAGNLYIAQNSALTNGASQISLDAVYTLTNGKEASFFVSPPLRNPVSPILTGDANSTALYVYSDTLGASFTFHAEAYQ